jgi:predicted regulator of Ras-like GTPase activity (Roadblock/LC7/MglB family)
MSYDGIPVDTFEKAAARDGLNASTLVAEIAAIAHQLKSALSDGGYGAACEMTVALENCTVVLRPVNEEYLLAVAMGPNGNQGKARYMLKIAAPRVAEEL